MNAWQCTCSAAPQHGADCDPGPEAAKCAQAGADARPGFASGPVPAPSQSVNPESLTAAPLTIASFTAAAVATAHRAAAPVPRSAAPVPRSSLAAAAFPVSTIAITASTLAFAAASKPIAASSKPKPSVSAPALRCVTAVSSARICADCASRPHCEPTLHLLHVSASQPDSVFIHQQAYCIVFCMSVGPDKPQLINT